MSRTALIDNVWRSALFLDPPIETPELQKAVQTLIEIMRAEGLTKEQVRVFMSAISFRASLEAQRLGKGKERAALFAELMELEVL